MLAAQGKSEIQRLPPYLTVQMVRFFYKVDVQQKAKILRKVPGPPASSISSTLLQMSVHSFLKVCWPNHACMRRNCFY